MVSVPIKVFGRRALMPPKSTHLAALPPSLGCSSSFWANRLSWAQLIEWTVDAWSAMSTSMAGTSQTIFPATDGRTDVEVPK